MSNTLATDDSVRYAWLEGEGWLGNWLFGKEDKGSGIHYLEVSNITSSSAVITWWTDAPCMGVVEYGYTERLGLRGEGDVRSGYGRMHRIRLTGLQPGEHVYYRVISGEDHGEIQMFTTADLGAGVPAVVYGAVPADCAIGVGIVKLRVRYRGQYSTTLSGVFEFPGLWQLNLGNMKDRTGKVFDYGPGMTVEVVVEGLDGNGDPAVVCTYEVEWVGDGDLSEDLSIVHDLLSRGESLRVTVLGGEVGGVEAKSAPEELITPERIFLERLLSKLPEYRQDRRDRSGFHPSRFEAGWRGGGKMGRASRESIRPERRNYVYLRGNVLQRELLDLWVENEEARRLLPEVGRRLGLEPGLKEVRVPLVAGWNMVGLPVRREEPVTAHGILREVVGSRMVVSWDEVNQSFGKSVFRVGDEILGEDFHFEEGVGYFLEMERDGEVVFRGREIRSPMRHPGGPGLTSVYLAGYGEGLSGVLLKGMDFLRFDERWQSLVKVEERPVTGRSIEGIIEGWIERTPYWDYTLPSLTVTSPVDSSEVYTREPMLEVIYGDPQSGVNLDSLRIVLDGEDVTSQFTVDSLRAEWYMSSPDTLTDGWHTLVATIEDMVGHSRSDTSSFKVVTAPPPAEAHFVNGYVYRGDVPGDTLTPVEGAAVVVEGIEGVIYTDSTGHYVFPTPGLGEYRLDITKEDFTYAVRNLLIEDGHGDVFVDDAYLSARDTVVVRITEEGGDVLNSDGSIYTVFPPGAVSDDIDVSALNLDEAEDLPWPLPEQSVFTYCAKFWPDEVNFADSVDIHQDNWRGFEGGTPLPIGHFNPESMIWEDEGMAVTRENGVWVDWALLHFMSWGALSLPVFPPIEEPSLIEEGSSSPRNDYEGDWSSGSPSLGDVKLKFGGSVVRHELPSVVSLGEERSLSLTYASHTVKTRVVVETMTEGIAIEDSLPPYDGTRLDVAGVRFEAMSESSHDTTVQRVRYDGRGEDGEFLGTGHYYFEDRVSHYEYAEYALADSFGGPPTDSTGIGTGFPVGFGVSVTGDLMIDNRIGSEFGAGWALDGLRRLYFRPDGDAMITEGGGVSRSYELSRQPVLDLAVSHENDNEVTVYQGDGNGGFGNWSMYFVGQDNYGIIAHDFNGDDALDLAVACIDLEYVSVFLGDGEGGFGSRQDFQISSSPYFITTGDFDSDEIPDLAVTTLNIDSVGILSGSGDGSFQAAVYYPAGDGPYDIMTADFNGDGLLDLAVTNWNSNNVCILEGNGDGSFVPPQFYNVGNAPQGMAGGDFNSDGILDIAVASSSDDSVSVLIGNGDGSFAAHRDYPVGDYPFDVVAGDFTGDGILDLAVTNSQSDNLTILLGTGNGEFVEGQEYLVGDNPRGLEVGDFNGDGILDLAIVIHNTNEISIMFGDGRGNFGNKQNYPTYDNYPSIITTADFNGDSYTVASVEFFDNFDDNSKDFDKWTEIYTDGTWDEVNQRTEFQVYETGEGNPSDWEGIESSGFRAILSPTRGLVITWDIISNIGSTGSVGNVILEVTDGTNWIHIDYYRWIDATRYWDSNNGTARILNGNKPDGTWDNELRIFSDRYFVRMDSDSSWEYSSIFETNSILSVRIMLKVGGNVGSLYTRSGFDNVRVEGTSFAPLFVSADGDITKLVINPDSLTYSLVYPDSSRVVFDSTGLQVETIDRVGNVTSYVYDSTDRLITVTYPGSLVTTLSYGPDGYLNSITDHANRITWFDHDTTGNLISITDPDSSVWRYEYDADHLLTKVLSPKGDSTLYAYDSWGYVTHIIGPDSSMNDFKASDSYNTLTDAVDAGYGTPNLLASVIRPVDLVNIFVNTEDDTTTFLTNGYGKVTKKTDTLGRIHRREYDSNGNLRLLVRPDTTSVSYIYDNLGNLLYMTEDSLGATLRVGYDLVHHLPIELEDAEGNLTVIDRDSLGNPVLVVSALGDTTFNSFDAQGLLTRTKNELGDSTIYEYDGLGRLIKVTDPLNNFTRFEYDTSGNMTAVIDAKGYRTEYEYDVMNRLTLVRNELGFETSYFYDGNGNLELLVDAGGDTTKYAYDAYDRLISLTDPLGHVEGYIYSTEGLLTGRVNSNGDTLRYVYDDVHRLTSRVDGTDTTSYAYDLADNLVRVEDSDSRIQYSYDVGQQLISVETGDSTNPSVVQPLVVLDYVRDLNGNITRRMDTEGDTVWYDYEAFKRLAAIRTDDGETTTYTYDDAGRLDTVERSNGTISDYDFNAAGWLVDLTHVKGVDTVAAFHYVYDDVGNRTVLTDLYGTHSFSYDSLHQVIGATHPQAYNPSEFYSYDALGNRDSSHVSSAYAYDSGNRLLSDDDYDYGWDNAGRQVWRREKATGDTTRYEYTVGGELVRAYDAGLEVRFAYDGEGRRVEKVVISNNGSDTSVVRYSYDGANLLFEHDVDTLRVRYLYGPGIDHVLESADTSGSYLHYSDGLGSVVKVTNVAGASVKSLVYDSFGNVVSDSGSAPGDRMRYAGREWDEELGFYYNRSRYYDPRVGRYILARPWGQDRGDVNLFRYVRNNPVNCVDPMGNGRGVEVPCDLAVEVGRGLGRGLLCWGERNLEGAYKNLWIEVVKGHIAGRGLD